MDIRLYPIRPSNNSALSHDGAGKIAGMYCKSFTLSAQLAVDATLDIPLINVANAPSIQSYVVQIRAPNGAINIGGAHEALYAPATGILTLTARTAAIAINSIITIFYIVAVK